MTDDERRMTYAMSVLNGLMHSRELRESVRSSTSLTVTYVVSMSWDIAEQMLTEEKKRKAQREMEGRP